MSVWGMHRRSVWRSDNTSPLIMDPERAWYANKKLWFSFFLYLRFIIMLIWILSYWPDIVYPSVLCTCFIHTWVAGVCLILSLSKIWYSWFYQYIQDQDTYKIRISIAIHYYMQTEVYPSLGHHLSDICQLCDVFFSYYDPSCSPRYCI